MIHQMRLSVVVVAPWDVPYAKATEIIKAACLQNEAAPEKLLNRYEKRFEKRKKRSENDPKRDQTFFSPSQAA